jgi:predicted DNA-binding WGR domain protein
VDFLALMAARPDELRSPIKHYLVLHRIDPEQGIRRFCRLMIKRDLFGTVRLVRNWGRIGTNGKEMIEIFADEITAEQALEAVARAKGEGILGSLIAAGMFREALPRSSGTGVFAPRSSLLSSRTLAY